MIRHFYFLLAAGTLLLLSPHHAFATPSRSPLPDSPTEAQRKAAAREKVATAKMEKVALRKSARSKFNFAAKMSHGMRAALGLDQSKAFTSPAERDWRLHRLQQKLKIRARMESKARMRRTHF